MKPLLKAACLVVLCCLASCSILPDHRFAGGLRIAQKDHWIELVPIALARTDNDKWYVCCGPPAEPVGCLEFVVGPPSYIPPSAFEIVRVDGRRNQRESLTFYRLSKEKEEKLEFDRSTHELWVLAQPSATTPASNLPEGRYQIKIHYRLDGQEYDAEWGCVYEVGVQVVRWSMSH